MPAVVDELDLGRIAGNGIGGFQIVENARPVRHSGKRRRWLHGRDDGSRPGQSKYTGKKGSPIHRFLLYRCPSP
jgi:hypothetical protein